MFIVDRPLLRWCASIAHYLTPLLPSYLLALSFGWLGESSAVGFILTVVIMIIHWIQLYKFPSFIRLLNAQFQEAYPGLHENFYLGFPSWELPAIIVYGLLVFLLPAKFYWFLAIYVVLCVVDVICILILLAHRLYWRHLAKKRQQQTTEIIEDLREVSQDIVPMGFVVRIDLETGEMSVGVVEVNTEIIDEPQIIDITPDENQDQNT